jgi:hypothetical protein
MDDFEAVVYRGTTEHAATTTEHHEEMGKN